MLFKRFALVAAALLSPALAIPVLRQQADADGLRSGSDPLEAHGGRQLKSGSTASAPTSTSKKTKTKTKTTSSKDTDKSPTSKSGKSPTSPKSPTSKSSPSGKKISKTGKSKKSSAPSSMPSLAPSSQPTINIDLPGLSNLPATMTFLNQTFSALELLGLTLADGSFPALFANTFPTGPGPITISNAEGDSVTVDIAEIVVPFAGLINSSIPGEVAAIPGASNITSEPGFFELHADPDDLAAANYTAQIVRATLNGTDGFLYVDMGDTVEGNLVVFIGFDFDADNFFEGAQVTFLRRRALQTRPGPFSVCMNSNPGGSICMSTETALIDNVCIANGNTMYVASFNQAYDTFEAAVVTAEETRLARREDLFNFFLQCLLLCIARCRLFVNPANVANCILRAFFYLFELFSRLFDEVQTLAEEEVTQAMVARDAEISAACTLLTNTITTVCIQCVPMPSVTPSAAPTVSPTASPTDSPSVTPSFAPTVSPSAVPTVPPTATPSDSPSVSSEPSVSAVPTPDPLM